MHSDLWQRRAGWLAMVTVVLWSGSAAQSRLLAEEEQGDPQPHRVLEKILQRRDVMEDFNRASRDGDFKALYTLTQQAFGGDGGKYWVGVECREASPELRAQLGLDDEGLVVLHVAEDSPAAKAGLKQHDVIVAAGDAKLARPQDLVKAVDATDGKEITLKIYHAGKQNTLQVAPGERPKETIKYLARPGLGMVFGDGPPAPLPDNVSVTISRHGKEPAKIKVSRGDEKWDLTDKELNELPDDLRPFVERMVGGGPVTINWQNVPNEKVQRWLAAPQIRIEGQPMPYFQPPQPGQPDQPGQRVPPFQPKAPSGQPGQPGMTPRSNHVDRHFCHMRRQMILQMSASGWRISTDNCSACSKKSGACKMGDSRRAIHRGRSPKDKPVRTDRRAQ